MGNKILEKLVKNKHLNEKDIFGFISELQEGHLSEAEIGAFIMGISSRSVDVDEFTHLVLALRNFSNKINFDAKNIVCSCGTGADGASSFNISTAAAIVTASCEKVLVAKHANCAISGMCGSSNLIQELGGFLAKNPEEALNFSKKSNIVFLHSPFFNSAINKINPVRQKLKMRSIFNFIGPLLNPANLTGQAFGVASVDMAKKIIEVLKNLQIKRAMVFCGVNPLLDEISICSETQLYCLNGGIVEEFIISPEEFGIARAPLEVLQGGDVVLNANIIKEVLKGEKLDSKVDVVAMNAAALLWAGEVVDNLEDGVSLAYNLIENGRAFRKLDEIKKWK